MTSGRLVLRDYQVEADAAVREAWASGTQRPAFVLPTGAGKTVVFAETLRRELEGGELVRHRDRALVLAHREELIGQAAGKLRDALGSEYRVGTVKATRNETLADVVVGSVATLRNSRRLRQLRGVKRVIVDEAHHAAAPSYVKILRELGAYDADSGLRVAGCTATMVRGDGKALGDVWQDIVYERSTAWMIGRGYLVRPRGVRVRVADLDLKAVRRSRGDYSEGDLGRALEGSLAPEAVAKAWAEHAHGRQGILFAPTVSATQAFATALRDAGYHVATVFGYDSAETRSAALEDFRAGRVQILCNCMVLTEGTDLPTCDAIVVARPTTNGGLYAQMIGRGLRLWPGKGDCLVLDVVGASTRHTLRTHIGLMGESLEFDDDELERADVEQLDDDEIVLDLAGDAFGAEPDDPSWLNGPLTSEIVDLFHGSASAWQRTAAGTWFLPAGNRFLAIVRAPAERGSAFDVITCDRYRPGVSDWVSVGVSDLSYAMAYAEANVTPAEMTTTRKERSWRTRQPSPKQKAYASKLGVLVEGRSAGEISAEIAYREATARLDPYLRPWMRG